MRSITFKADGKLIERARRVARSRHQTLKTAFREWLERYAAQAGNAAAMGALMRSLKHVRSNGPYSRRLMNKR